VLDPEVRGQQVGALGVAAGDDHVEAVGGEHLRAQEAELAVAGDQRPRARCRAELFDDLDCGRHGFDERCGVVREVVGDRDQVARRQHEALRERARTAEDAENRALLAVPSGDRVAGRAVGTGRVDLTDDATARERAVDRTADELVTGNTREPHVATREREVGRAHAGAQHVDAALVGVPRLGALEGRDPGRAVFEDERAHARHHTESVDRARVSSGHGRGRARARANRRTPRRPWAAGTGPSAARARGRRRW
jgi:hypothetical protein